MRLVDFDYALPEDRIAQSPAVRREDARMLVLSRAAGALTHSHVRCMPAYLRAGDLLVLNDTRVIPARLRGLRPTGGQLEVLLVEPVASDEWDAIVRGQPRVGEVVEFTEGQGTWVAMLGGGRWRLRLEVPSPFEDWLARNGELPLPPYIHRPQGPTADDLARYQTEFAAVDGAIAAPTAGLHLTKALLAELASTGVTAAVVTLHVGPGTFLPIRDGDLASYAMEAERSYIPAETVDRIEATRRRGGRVVAVGTTAVRALESAAQHGALEAGPRPADLFIRPGHEFRVVDGILTNFHLPRTPLLAMVAAFASWDRLRIAYTEAVTAGYRFYSYGDAMLLV